MWHLMLWLNKEVVCSKDERDEGISEGVVREIGLGGY
jgi:hypothetical protein